MQYITFESMETAHIYVYGVIDFWQDDNASEWGYVNLKDVKNQYEAQKECKDITVHIHSEGGVVTEGFAIHDYLRSLGKPIKTVIEGTCASIATVIALAGDTRVMTSNANFFIHNPLGFAGGDKEQIQKYADELDRIEVQIAEFYASKTKITKDDALQLMKVETTFTAEEALEKGFITEIATVMRAVAKFNPNNNKMSKEKMTKKEAESKLDKALNAIKNIFSSKPENKIVQDANGDEIDFTDLAEDDTPEVGDAATIDGYPAAGERLMPNGETYVFADGKLSEIKPKEDDPEGGDDPEEMQALQTEVSNLKKELKKEKDTVKNLKAENKKLKDSTEQQKKALKDVQDEIEEVKKSIGSGFKVEDKSKNHKNNGGEGESRRVWKQKEE